MENLIVKDINEQIEKKEFPMFGWLSLNSNEIQEASWG
jgi:hypothetical protein